MFVLLVGGVVVLVLNVFEVLYLRRLMMLFVFMIELGVRVMVVVFLMSVRVLFVLFGVRVVMVFGVGRFVLFVLLLLFWMR